MNAPARPTYEQMRADCHARGLMIGVRAPGVFDADPVRAQKEIERQHLAIAAEWIRDGKPIPMCGDVPISKALFAAIARHTFVRRS